MRLRTFIASNFDELWPYLVRCLYKYYPQEAEDFAADGIARALQKSDVYQGDTDPANLKKYICKIAFNEAARYKRKRSARQQKLALLEQTTPLQNSANRTEEIALRNLYTALCITKIQTYSTPYKIAFETAIGLHEKGHLQTSHKHYSNIGHCRKKLLIDLGDIP